ncbi:MAG TPA: hypothetical protein VEI97_01990, partial [bacterium]|nr:hypothetical protein [bacterium]
MQSPLPSVPWWQSAWTLEKWRWRQAWSALARAKRGDRVRRWLGLLFRILWPFGSLLVFAAGLMGIKDPAAGQYVLAMVSLFTFLILLVAAIKFAYQTFFSAPDLELLQGLPLSPRGIFVAKYLDNLAFSNQLVALFAIGPWLAYAWASGWTPWQALLAAAGVFFLPVYTTALGIAVSLLVSRLVPKARLRETLMLGSMGVSVFFYVAMRQAIQVDAAGGPPDAAMFLWPWLPTTWLVLWAMDPATHQAQTYLLQFFFLGTTLFVLAAWLGDAAYHWGLTHLERDGGRAGSGASPWLLRWVGSTGPGRAVWFKDLLTFGRDPRQWYYLIFFAVLLFSPAAAGESGPEHPLMRTLGNAFILVFMATMALQELTVLGVSREGPKRWLLQALPFSPGAILWGKYSVILTFTALLATIGGLCEAALGRLPWNQLPA